MRIVRALFFLLLAAPVVAQPRSGRGNLQIRCATGYQIFVDGKLAGICNTKDQGFLVTGLAAGDHTIGVHKSGYVPGVFTIAIQPGVDNVLKASTLKLRRRIKFRPAEDAVDMTVESPPMMSDDTGTPGDRNMELNFSASAQLSHDRKLFDLPRIDVNYGLGENLQLKYEVPWEIERRIEKDAVGNDTRVHAHGLGDSTVGVKYRFYDDDASQLSLAVYPQVEFRTPGGKSEEDGGVASGLTTWSLPLLFTKEFERLAVTANAGVEKATGEGVRAFGSAGCGTRLSPRLALLGELVGQDLNSSDARRILLNVGFRYKVDQHQAFGAAIGRDLHAGDGEKQTYVTFSYQRYFGDK
jgi:hypothetical protein